LLIAPWSSPLHFYEAVCSNLITAAGGGGLKECPCAGKFPFRVEALPFSNTSAGMSRWKTGRKSQSAISDTRKPAHPNEDSQSGQENQANIQKGSQWHAKDKPVALIVRDFQSWIPDKRFRG